MHGGQSATKAITLYLAGVTGHKAALSSRCPLHYLLLHLCDLLTTFTSPCLTLK